MAVIISIIAALVAGAVEMLLIYSLLPGNAAIVAASVILVFLTVYLVTRLLLGNFIYQKMTPIYNTIHKLKKSEKSLREELEKADITDDLNREVEDWASDKTQEISRLKEMEIYRKEFLGNVSHEMKTPIFNIQGYVLTLLDGGIDDPAVNKLYLKRAEKSIARLINIVEDLDTISRLDSGEVKIRFENFDMVQLIDDIFDMQEIRAKDNNIKLRLRNKAGKPVMVHADRNRIQEVMVNLVVNSIKYGRKKGTTCVELSDMGNKIMVEVSDNGPGIPKEDLPRIFERFYRVDKSRARNQGGTGLGLAIVKHVIEAHNQEISVRSRENKGTAFNFTLMKGR
ncbi:MAG: ATP-binding protein [Bacteroidales bacterium]